MSGYMVVIHFDNNMLRLLGSDVGKGFTSLTSEKVENLLRPLRLLESDNKHSQLASRKCSWVLVARVLGQSRERQFGDFELGLDLSEF